MHVIAAHLVVAAGFLLDLPYLPAGLPKTCVHETWPEVGESWAIHQSSAPVALELHLAPKMAQKDGKLSENIMTPTACGQMLFIRMCMYIHAHVVPGQVFACKATPVVFQLCSCLT